MSMESSLYPIHVFRFHVEFMETLLGSNKSPKDIILCHGAFAECTGLEATMEPKVIKAGGAAGVQGLGGADPGFI